LLDTYLFDLADIDQNLSVRTLLRSEQQSTFVIKAVLSRTLLDSQLFSNAESAEDEIEDVVACRGAR
jgi:hypothetical protein